MQLHSISISSAASISCCDTVLQETAEAATDHQQMLLTVCIYH